MHFVREWLTNHVLDTHRCPYMGIWTGGQCHNFSPVQRSVQLTFSRNSEMGTLAEMQKFMLHTPKSSLHVCALLQGKSNRTQPYGVGNFKPPEGRCSAARQTGNLAQPTSPYSYLKKIRRCKFPYFGHLRKYNNPYLEKMCRCRCSYFGHVRKY